MRVIDAFLHPTRAYREEQAEKIKAEADTRVQAREADGRLWLAYDGVPLIEAEAFKKPLTEAIKDAREAYIRHATRRL